MKIIVYVGIDVHKTKAIYKMNHAYQSRMERIQSA